MEKKYLYEEHVKLLRTFNFGKERAEIEKYDGSRFVVDMSELTDTPKENKAVVKKETQHDSALSNKEEVEEEIGDAPLPDGLPVHEKQEDKNPSITATKLTDNTETVIGSIGSDTYKKFVSNNKLNEEAIALVLSGSQKTHKGYSFKYE